MTWVLTLPADHVPIGMLDVRPGPHGLELGYVLAKAYWNHGYMTEAVEAVAAWLLDQPEVYPFVTHAFAYTGKGAVGVIKVLPAK